MRSYLPCKAGSKGISLFGLFWSTERFCLESITDCAPGRSVKVILVKSTCVSFLCPSPRDYFQKVVGESPTNIELKISHLGKV